MKYNRCLKTGTIVFISLFLVSTAFAWFDWPEPVLPDIPQEWTVIDPEEVYPDFNIDGLTPSCAACPPTVDSDTGEERTYDPKFTFFVKGGTTNKLVVYFQGGGGCWHENNCLYEHTYFEEVIDITAYDTRLMGIFDTKLLLNPFKDWYFVYIPYCTGDVHWGANDADYDDTRGVYGSPQTIRHRGFINFQVVLQWIRDNFENPEKIFVSGSSAGSYGAIMGFPYIKKSFPASKVYVLGDAGNGVTTESFQTDAIENWNIQIPEWIPGFECGYDPDMTIDFVYRKIAEYYRFSKIAQFTTAWDWNQTFFYNLMVGDNIEHPETWETGWPASWSAWNDQMLDYVYSAAEMPNYRYYIAAGDYHTIMMTPDFYRERSGGIPFFMWVKAMVRNPFGLRGDSLEGLWQNLECTDCEGPVP